MAGCDKSCPEAAPGDFYTLPEQCITCRAPEAAAPDFVGRHEDGSFEHCRILKQPASPEDLERLIRAMHASCISPIRYRGNDPRVLLALERAGEGLASRPGG